jgi:hypothetical protein
MLTACNELKVCTVALPLQWYLHLAIAKGLESSSSPERYVVVAVLSAGSPKMDRSRR